MYQSTAKPNEAENEIFAQMKIDMVKAHLNYLMLHIFRTEVENHPWKDIRIKPLMLNLFRIAALKSLTECIGPIFDSGYFSPSASRHITDA